MSIFKVPEVGSECKYSGPAESPCCDKHGPLESGDIVTVHDYSPDGRYAAVTKGTGHYTVDVVMLDAIIPGEFSGGLYL